MDYVAFPSLGWRFELSDTIVEFQLFGMEFSIKWYGVLIAVGFLLAMIYAVRRAPKLGVDPDRLIDVVLVSTLFAFIGARLYYVLFSDERAAYFKDPIRILYVWEGGLAIYGGIIFAFLTALWMCRVRKINTRAAFDLAGLGFLIGQGIGRWGNFFNQEAFGGNTTLPWGMTGSKIAAGLNGDTALYDRTLPVHPTFLYESLWCLLGFILLHILSKKAYKFKGEIFSLYLVWYGIGRFAIESLRTDSLYLGTMRVSQLVAILTILLGIVLFFVFKSRTDGLPKELFVGDGAIPLEEADVSLEASAEDAVETINGEEVTVERTGEAAAQAPEAAVDEAQPGDEPAFPTDVEEEKE